MKHKAEYAIVAGILLFAASGSLLAQTVSGSANPESARAAGL